MTAANLGEVLAFGLAAWLAVLAGVVLHRVLLQPGALRGLLSRGETEGGGGSTADRIQMLTVFLIALGGYAVTALRAAGGDEPLTSLPEAPHALLSVFAGSQAVYLGVKAVRMDRNATQTQGQG